MKKLPLTSYAEFTTPDVGVRIERMADGAVYDPDRKVFVPPALGKNPLVILTPSKTEENRVDANVDLNPAQFKDGGYLLHYFETSASSGGHFATKQITVTNGDFLPPTPTDVAVRMANIQVGAMTLRDAIADIQAKVNRLVAQTPAKP